MFYFIFIVLVSVIFEYLRIILVFEYSVNKVFGKNKIIVFFFRLLGFIDKIRGRVLVKFFWFDLF